MLSNSIILVNCSLSEGQAAGPLLRVIILFSDPSIKIMGSDESFRIFAN